MKDKELPVSPLYHICHMTRTWANRDRFREEEVSIFIEKSNKVDEASN